MRQPVEQRFLEQWFFRISEYAERLLDNLDTIDWSETTQDGAAQLDRAERRRRDHVRGRTPEFSGSGATSTVGDSALDATDIVVFTTRPDTIFGATYMVLAPEHPLVEHLTTPDQRDAVAGVSRRHRAQDIVARKVNKEKTGVFTGAYAINPATGSRHPDLDRRLRAHGLRHRRDHGRSRPRRARLRVCHRPFDLPIVRVDRATGRRRPDAELDRGRSSMTTARTSSTPAQFDGTPVAEAKRGDRPSGSPTRGAAKPVVNYRLHDWCISRQRYWGPPIPIIYCDECGPQAGAGEGPAGRPAGHRGLQARRLRRLAARARLETWYHVPCPKCGGEGARETDVSDTFLDSAWYFLRYPSADRDDVPFDRRSTRKWLPVTSYIGGNEHAVLHLMYSRFITMVLHDIGQLDFEEPFTKFRAHGHIIRDGAKMSKTKGNVVNPDQFFEQWGADAFRMYLMFLGPFQEGGDFRDAGISGVRRFLDRLWAGASTDATPTAQPDAERLRKLHQTIRKVSDDTARLCYNTAIAAMMEYMNALRKGERTPHRDEVAPLVQLVGAVRAAHRRGALGTAWRNDVASWMPAGRGSTPRSRARTSIAAGGAGERQAARDDPRRAATSTQEAALAAAMAEPQIAKFVTTEPRKVVFVPGRLLNLVV